ncbi:MAG: sugar phosphate nucleotidyltransferase, partial [Verrucomicrobiota bacterium]
MPNHFALILAGGSGERFWPLSRTERPKQLLNLFDETTLLEKTIARLEGLIPKENILILTNVDQEPAVREIAGDLPTENIIAEPAKRDTAPAIALGIGWVASKDPDATMAVLPADQLIKDEAEFRSVLSGALHTAELSGSLVTIGVKPTWACPSYGYVERGKKATVDGLQEDVAVFEVERFREKPNSDLAETFLNAGNFTWNAGMFIWTLQTVVTELTSHAPDLADFVREIRQSPDIKATLEGQFEKQRKISIDYALMEKASRVLNIEATFDWDDVGSWISVAKYLEADETNNRGNAPLSVLDARDNVVFSKEKNRRIALLGVENLIVVETGDALLVTTRDQADRIKHLVKDLPAEL